MANTENKERKFVSFAALDPYIQDNIVDSTEKEIKGQKYIQFGDNNVYPNYIFDLYKNVATLQSIINGTADYVVGDGVTSHIIGLSDIDAEKLVRNMAMSYLIFGSVALNVLRNRLGGVARVIPLDIRNIRSDKKNEYFWYSTEWAEKSYGRVHTTLYPVFDIDGKDSTSIYYYKNALYGTYGLPIWGASTIAAETEKEISKFHINSIKNGFASNVIVSFNNGVPTDEIREEIEEAFEEKFTGSENAGMPMLNFADDKDHSLTVEKIDTDSFADRYKALTDRCKQEMFTAFRAVPCLFGITDDNKGFAQQEFDDAFRLYNRTVVRPVQKIIVNAINDIYGVDNAIEIAPFTVEWNENNNEVEETVE